MLFIEIVCKYPKLYSVCGLVSIFPEGKVINSWLFSVRFQALMGGCVYMYICKCVEVGSLHITALGYVALH